MAGVLEGIRVLDFGRYIAGPFCATLLGDLGAEVIRIERPQGGEDRDLNPIGSDESGGMVVITGRNKSGMTLKLGSEEIKPIVERLVKSADVVIANMPASILKKIGTVTCTQVNISVRERNLRNDVFHCKIILLKIKCDMISTYLDSHKF